MIGACPLPCVCPERVDTIDTAADTAAVIVAGGTGERFGDKRGKQFVDLAGLPVLAWSLLAFDAAPSVAEIVVVVPKDRERDVETDVLAKIDLRHEVTLSAGGATRQESVLRGLSRTSADVEFVAIHDGARPLIEVEAIERCLEPLRAHEDIDGAILATRAIDTCKVVDGEGIIRQTLDRSVLWCAQTPQCFRRSTILDAHTVALVEGFSATDDASIIEWRGGRVKVVEGSYDNIKVTVPEDLVIATATLASRMGIM